MSIIFYHNEGQKSAVLESMRVKEAGLGQAIRTEVIPLSGFYFAEDYHQKYYLQGQQVLFNELTAMYPDISELIQSTAVARVNGYLGGYGSLESLKKQINSFGLSQIENEKLLQIGSQLLFRNN
jgi:peptide-methionine (S)-S-oxide reductase